MHIPYLELSPVELGSFTIRPFTALMVTGILVAHFLMIRRARRVGLNPDLIAWLSLVMVGVGLMGAVLFKFTYHTEHLSMPLWKLFRQHLSISSFGGIFGGLIGAWGYFRYARIPASSAMRYMDAVAFCFPAGWVFGRTGCFLVHDHPGVRSESLLAVAYPGGARIDLAFLEILMTLGIVGLFLILDRLRAHWPDGFYLSIFLTLYGLFRVAIDQFHVDPPRYLGFAVDQWAGASAALVGIALGARIYFHNNSLESNGSLEGRLCRTQG